MLDLRVKHSLVTRHPATPAHDSTSRQPETERPEFLLLFGKSDEVR